MKLVAVVTLAVGVGWLLFPAGVLGDGVSPIDGVLGVSGFPGLSAEAAYLQEQAQRNSPEAVEARLASSTGFEGLTATQAAAADAEAFPVAIDAPAGGPPLLPAGQNIVGFADAQAAQVDLGSDEAGVIESTQPMAKLGANGQWSAVNLGLEEGQKAFSVRNPLVAVRIPKKLGEGVALSETDLSVTPVDGSGNALGDSDGLLDGAAVVYANTQQDTDTIVKPSTLGLEIDTVLRSVESPETLEFRVGLPQDASLVQENAEGPVEIVKEGAVLATVPVPWAQDATGYGVPVTMGIIGDTIVVKVAGRSGGYQYPLQVDPEFATASETLNAANWHFSEAPGGGYTHGASIWEGIEPTLWMQHEGAFGENDWAYWTLQAKGDTHIYEINTSTVDPGVYSGSEYLPPYYARSWLALRNESGVEAEAVLSVPSERQYVETKLCIVEGCAPTAGKQENAARFSDTTLIPESGSFSGRLVKAEAYFAQPKETHPTVSYNGSTEVDGTENVAGVSKAWLGPESGAFEFKSKDLGLGVSATKVETWNGKEWVTLASRNYLGEKVACQGVQCLDEEHEALTYASLKGVLPNGEDLIRVAAGDPAGLWSSEHAEGETTIKVDTVRPHGLGMTGLALEGEDYSLSERIGHLRLAATDGEGAVPSSGIKTIELYVDGREFGKAAGSCSPGPCAASGEWALNGSELGVGQHVLTEKATDAAGNFAIKEYTLVVHSARPVAFGPGVVNPQTGNFTLEAGDVSLSGGAGALNVTRSYSSQDLTAGVEGTMGPQWSMSLGSLASLEVLPDGSVMVVGPSGLAHFALGKGGGFKAPEGDTNLTLEAKEGKEYLLRNPSKGTTTRFTLPAGAKLWMPTVSEGPVATDTMTDTYEAVKVEGKTIVEPTEELAAHPSAACSAKFEKGCRALFFQYAKETKAGESAEEWGEFNGRLMAVAVEAWSPAGGEMVKSTVAEYAYDKLGRLRAEWNPSMSPALKTVYGYGPEGLLTSVQGPGQQPWLLAYGQVPGDIRAGRLLSATRLAAKTAAGGGEAPKSSEAPKLSTATPGEGKELRVSEGAWGGAPLSYSYQWERCSATGGECAVIQGATNQGYTPLYSDEEHELLAQVTATNAYGSVVASSVAELVPGQFFAPSLRLAFGKEGEGSGQLKAPGYSAVDGSYLLVADTKNNRVDVFNLKGEYVSSFGSEGTGNGQFKEPTGVTVADRGDIFVADSGNKRIEKFGSSFEYKAKVATSGSPVDLAGNQFELVATDATNNRVDTFDVYETTLIEAGHFGTLKSPTGIALGSSHALFVSNTGSNTIAKYSLKEYAGTLLAEYGGTGTGNGQFKEPKGLALQLNGEVWVVDSGNSRIQLLTEEGKYVTGEGTAGGGEGQFSKPSGVAVVEHEPYVVDTGNNRVEWFWYDHRPADPPVAPALPPESGSNAVWTLEYQLPLSGTGLPDMESKETARWAQKDTPVEGTAIFPPDKPMGWPAKEYTRASILYLDDEARTVNALAPTGGISTTEYNSTNNVVRTLSATNRLVALKESKPEEAAKLLSTESVYEAEGSQLKESLGPQHKVKLAGGAEVLARNHAQYYYDKGAPVGESYDLQTESTDGAVYEGKEAEVRTSTTSYGGQGGLGWKLREPTSVTTDPAGLKLTSTTIYEPSTGSVIETRGPGDAIGNETTGPVTYSTKFGVKGEGEQAKAPQGVAVDGSGDVWVADSAGNRLEEFNAAGRYLSEVAAEDPTSLVFDSSGDLWVLNGKAGRVEEFPPPAKGEKAVITTFGAFTTPVGLAIDHAGNIWVANTGASNLQEYSGKAGKYTLLRTVKKGALEALGHPQGVAVDSAGNIWVSSNTWVEEFSSEGVWKSIVGGKGENQLKKAAGVTIDASGDLWVTDANGGRVQKWPASLKETEMINIGITGAGPGQLKAPEAVAVDSSGNAWVADTGNNRVQELTGTGKYLGEVAVAGVAEGAFKKPSGIALDSSGNVWVADSAGGRIQEFSATGSYLQKFGLPGSEAGRLSGPQGIALDSSGNVWVADTANKRVQEFSSSGKPLSQFAASSPWGITIDSSGNVWVTGASGHVEEYASTGKLLLSFGSEGAGEGQLSGPEGIARDSSGDIWVADTANNRIQEFSSTGKPMQSIGKAGSGEGQLRGPEGIAIDASGDVWVIDTGNDRVSEYNAKGEYIGSSGTEGSGNAQFSSPDAVAVTSTGHLYITDAANTRVQEWVPVTRNAHDTQAIYYTAELQLRYPGCGEHPEWVGLLCQSQPGGQPTKGGLPALPITTYAYNMWDEPETTTETFGTTTRTRKTTFDAAGRGLTSEVKASGTDETLPTVTDKYNKTTGALEEQSATIGGKLQTLTSTQNSLGQLTEYTDADGNKTSYTYDIDGRVTAVNNGKDEQKYAYNKSTGALAELNDSNAGIFTASYDAGGNMSSETYPNGITATYTRNPVDDATGVEYSKKAYCGTKCTWYNQTQTPSIHGETLEQANTLATDAYAHDAAGRLTEVQEKTSGEGCITRIYAYDQDSNRTSLTTRKPGSEKCAAEGGTTENHSYDEADRLDDTGVAYETLGNITKLPAADAGGTELTSSYYVDGQLYKQTQGTQSFEYKLDPESRAREIITGTLKTINHYAGPGETPAWTSEEGTSYSCNIPGIDGGLAAIDTSGKTIIQLHDLEGDIVATAGILETETEPLKTYNSTEFGVPTTTKPPKYSWLGASGIASELPSGVISQGSVSYIPQLGRQLQTQATPPPTPINAATAYTSTISPWVAQTAGPEAAQQVAAGQAALQAIEQANKPPGTTPLPAGSEGCNEEIEGCGHDPQHGDDSFYQCKVWSTWGQETWFIGQFECAKAPQVMEMQIMVQEILWGGVEGGKYKTVYIAKEKFKDQTKGALEGEPESGCAPHKWYRGWVYGRVWIFGQFVWSASEVNHRARLCYEQGDLIPPGEAGIEGDEEALIPDN